PTTAMSALSLHDALPISASWRVATRMAYPVDLPGRRVVRVDYALSWFRIRKIPLVAQQVQADTYLACGLVSETVNHMVDAFVREDRKSTRLNSSHVAISY